MKFSEKWLREWVNPPLNTQQLASQLSMSGLEVDSVESQENDTLIEIDISPNRGDCLSILGVAREIAAINQVPLKELTINAIKPGFAR